MLNFWKISTTIKRQRQWFHVGLSIHRQRLATFVEMEVFFLSFKSNFQARKFLDGVILLIGKENLFSTSKSVSTDTQYPSISSIPKENLFSTSKSVSPDSVPVTVLQSSLNSVLRWSDKKHRPQNWGFTGIIQFPCLTKLKKTQLFTHHAHVADIIHFINLEFNFILILEKLDESLAVLVLVKTSIIVLFSLTRWR